MFRSSISRLYMMNHVQVGLEQKPPNSLRNSPSSNPVFLVLLRCCRKSPASIGRDRDRKLALDWLSLEYHQEFLKNSHAHKAWNQFLLGALAVLKSIRSNILMRLLTVFSGSS